MKRIGIFCFLVLGIISISQAQTKLIGHKSHSGSKATFKSALDNDLFDMGLSDFGEPDWFHAEEKLDSVVYMNETTVLVYRRFADHEEEDWGKRNDEENWISKTDTLINHPLLSRKYDLHNVRYQLRQYYDFRNYVDEIKFIGYTDEPEKYENSKPKESEPKENIQPTKNYTPLNIEEPKECTKPKVEIEEQKTEEQPKKEVEEDNRRALIEIEKPKAVLVAHHEKEIIEEEIVELVILKSETSTTGIIGLFGFVSLMMMLSFFYFKKS